MFFIRKNKITNFITKVILISLILIIQPVYAAHFTNNFTVISVMPSNLGLHVELSPTPDQCNGSWWGNQFLIEKTAENYEGLVSAMLTAFISEKKIRAVHYTTTGTGECGYNNWLLITVFQIVK